MIVEWLMSVAASVVGWLADWWPAYDLPTFIADFDNQVNGLLRNLSGVGVWADWGYLLVCVGSVVALWGITLLVKLALKLWAMVPFVGGSG